MLPRKRNRVSCWMQFLLSLGISPFTTDEKKNKTKRVQLKWYAQTKQCLKICIETSARPLFPQWSHHVYPQFLPGSHPNYQNAPASNMHHNHSNNPNMPRISTPSTPTTTPTMSTTPKLSQTVLNSSKAQSTNHHLHNHYHYPLHLANNSHQQHQTALHNRNHHHSHVNGAVNTHTMRARNHNTAHKTITINNNNYQFRTDSGIFGFCEHAKRKKTNTQKKQQHKW